MNPPDMHIPGYKIVRLIAEGGMASVYLALQESLDRPVALKLLRKFDNPAQAQRFFNEGKIIASLEHRNIITIYDLGLVGERHYLAMEFLQGGDLRERINTGMLPLDALEVVEVLGSCLSFVHRKGIIHRDIKPENILFRQDGTVVLTDFGVAKDLESNTTLTMDGTTLGSPHYLSPEQAESKPLDGRADIYSLGIVFYEMLTGVKPFQGDSAIEIIIAHLTTAIPPLPPQLQCFQALLSRMIAKSPEDRFASAEELVDSVRRLRNSLAERQATETHSCVRILQEDPPPEFTHTIAQQFALAPVAHNTPPKAFKLSVLLIALLVATGLTASLLLLYSPDKKPPPQPQAPLQAGSKPDSPSPVENRQATQAIPEKQQIPQVLEEKPPAAQASDVSPQRVKKPPMSVKKALQEAEKILNEKTLTIPKLKQAYDYYQFTLKSNPKRPEALRGANIIANRLISIKVKIGRYLTAAEAAVKDGRFIEPEKNNAVEFYRRILELEPGHPEAEQGIKDIAGLYADRAAAHLHKSEISEAERNVRLGLSVQADDPRLLDLAAKIKAAVHNNIESPETPFL
ncbi:MAG: protein kinase domain-containing protein [Gammaproteobacteria bacterium]